MPFTEVTFTQNESELAMEAINKLVELMESKGYSGWTYSEADLEIILIGVLAGLALPAAQVASVVPDAIFRQFGTQLLHVPFNEGAAATATTKWTIISVVGVRQIPAGTQIEAGGLGFYVEVETEVPSNATEVLVPVVALERGTEFNKISGVAAQVNPLAFVTEVVFVGETSGGTNEQSDEEYLVELANALTLQAPRPITAEDYASFILDTPSSVVPTGVTIGRATSIDGYAEGTVEKEATVTSGSAVMTEITGYAGITVGTEIVGTDVPIGTTVAKLTSGEEGKSELEMSAKATGSPGKKAYKFKGTYNNQRYVTTWVTNKEGKALSSTAMKDIEEYVAKFREINFKAKVLAATYNELFVTTKLHVLPGYETATVEANVKAALERFLSPETWGSTFFTGNPVNSSGSQWLNYVNGTRLYATVRYNQLIQVVENATGVAYVFAGSEGLKVGFAENPTGTTDLAMAGAAPLPTIKAANIVITTG